MYDIFLHLPKIVILLRRFRFFLFSFFFFSFTFQTYGLPEDMRPQSERIFFFYSQLPESIFFLDSGGVSVSFVLVYMTFSFSRRTVGLYSYHLSTMFDSKLPTQFQVYFYLCSVEAIFIFFLNQR